MKQICHECNGTGVVPEPRVWRSNIHSRLAVVCPECLGSGEEEREEDRS